jgi:diguanylate cyclase (GGDEF)-like protein/PAS domain S-box-containing protein
MSGILVVERSATLSHLLQRTMAAAHIEPEKSVVNFGECQALLQSAQGAGKPIKLLIIGAPQRPSSEFDGLLSYLTIGEGAKIPVLLMAYEKSPIINAFLLERRHAQLLLWNSFSRIPQAVKQLLPASDEVKRSSNTSEVTNEMAAVPTPVVERASGGLNVLFVDDSQSVRFAYRQLLTAQGFAVDVASTLQEAIEKARDGIYDLMIVDYYLPDGNGDELVIKLKALPNCRNVPIAIITGTYKDSIIKKCLEAGAVECMFKNEVLDLTMARIRALARTIEVQKNSETERRRLDGILGSVGDGVYGVDEFGAITFINPTGVRLLGYVDENELIGKSAQSVFHFAAEDGASLGTEEGPMQKAYQRSNEQAISVETVFWRRGGEALPVECSIVGLSIGSKRQGTVVVFRDISERKSADRLRWELNHDALTGMANRRHFTQLIGGEIERRRERGGYSALVYIDIDRYSLMVEEAGESAAQRVLREISQRLVKRLREDDASARLHEDHLGLILAGVQLENLFTIADSFRELVSETASPTNQKKLPVTASVGVAIISRDTPSSEYALEHARLACEQAKRRGRNQTQIFVAESDAKVARELDSGWIQRIREALQEERFVLIVQPIVSANNIKTVADDLRDWGGWKLHHPNGGEIFFEILIRMVGRDGQFISPSVFVPLAERVGLMQKIDLWVVSRVLRQLESAKVPTSVCFNVNLSGHTLQDIEALKTIEEWIKAAPVSASRLVFEVTETSEIGSLHMARRFMQNMRKLGCRFALDDFGSGFSSLSHLKQLPVDFVKIEGSLVAEIMENEIDRTMVASINGMAHSLKLKVIAEHVDNESALLWLAEQGIDFVQGNFLGEPKVLNDVAFEQLQ